MKFRKARLLCALLAALMLLGTCASCADTTESKNPETQASTQPPAENQPVVTSPESEFDPSETVLKDDLPDDLNYRNDEIVFVSNYREGWTSGEIAVEKITNDEINDAVYERNLFVEARLGVKINNIQEQEANANTYIQKVATVIQSGTHEYDVMAATCHTTLNQSLNGILRDMRDLKYLDFDKPWWSQGLNEVIEYRGSQFAVSGSMLLSLYRFTFVTVFNKDMFEDNKIPYLYEDVEAGTWTLDRQIELTPVFHIDNGEQGVQDEKEDVFGFVTNDLISVDPYWSSCDVTILRKDANGDYEYVLDPNRLHSVADKVLKLLYETGGATYDYKHVGSDDEQTYIREMFARDGAAMATLRILELESGAIRNMSSQYGVVPMPKYDATQDVYRTLPHDWFTVVSIPTTIDDERFQEVGAVLEAMASHSYDNLRPAYYESTLRTKIVQDPESAAMLDMIINNIRIDAGIIYTQVLNIHHGLRGVCGTGENTIISDYKKIGTQVKSRRLPDMLKKLDKVCEMYK